ncbi:LytR/AlgR family response regulator transcription factor [Massilibacteroides vaginae]|uniref:LytR/AlgR family response regulator transcription factor n=1 Tax=Massilibacteroides vaginae TaxID=1673718 RepID=UPI000A1C9690|nr:LytTR family DNA-binding domain-containing protein [Massilibacteroides vaginae]
MKVLIVEDETTAYENIVDMLFEIDPLIEVLGNTESVTQTVAWLQLNPAPDLILMDIHLSDGSAFSIFDHIEIETPIIFTTAYDEYAIDAFKVNSIDYLLKPIKISNFKQALNKFSKLTSVDVLQYLSQLTKLAPQVVYEDKILLPFRDKLLPIDLHDVSFIYTTGKQTTLYLKNGDKYLYSKSLEQIIRTLNPADFFRANKQFIISRESVKNITIWFDSRLLITLDIEAPERLYVSKNKASEFRTWMVKCKQ